MPDVTSQNGVEILSPTSCLTITKMIDNMIDKKDTETQIF